MKEILPVYQIDQFQSDEFDKSFYVNKIDIHAKLHKFAEFPHKHDFFLLLYITKGSGNHQVDFEDFEIVEGRFFFVKPGQMHCWNLSEDIEGFVFFHSKDFYDNYFSSHTINNFHFFKNYQTKPFLDMKKEVSNFMEILLAQLMEEYTKNELMRISKVHSIIHLIYIEIARLYQGELKPVTSVYLDKLNKFEALIEEHYLTHKFPRDYASMLSISEKHLNRIVKFSLNKTSTELIANRIIIEAKRMLLHSLLPINQISEELGFNEKSYFNRFFKKRVVITPKQFRDQFSNNK
jgi:AraC-like DNA-binding protein